MFIKYTLIEEIILQADSYTENTPKSIKSAIFAKYLFKIITMPDLKNNSTQAICIKIQSINIEDNIILRKTAQMKIKVSISLLVLILIPGEYYEGIVSKCDIKGIVVKFIGGLLEGTIGLQNLHKDTIYNENENQWILATGDGQAKGYQWKIGAAVRFKIDKVFWNQPYEGAQEEAPTMADLVHLRANEAGLGPIEWWI